MRAATGPVPTELGDDALRERVRPLLGDEADALDEIDLACLRGAFLRFLRDPLPSPEHGGPEGVTAEMIRRSLRVRQRLAEKLLREAGQGTALSLDVRRMYGVLSRQHEEVIRSAVRSGQLTLRDAVYLYGNGEELTAHLGDAARVTAPLRFRTLRRSRMPLAGGPLREPGELWFEEAVRIETEGEAFEILVSHEVELAHAGRLEATTVAWLESTLQPESTLVDAGANVGLYSLYAACGCPGSRVIAFEPEPLNFARLAANLHHNGAAGVLAFPLALAGSTGLSTFGVSHFAPGGWSHVGVGAHRGGSRGERLLPAETVHRTGCVTYALDDFLASADFLPPPSHLKIDVDGPEIDVLQGAQRTLASPGLRHLLIELVDGEQEAAARPWIEPHGLKPVGKRVEGFGNRIYAKD